MPGFRRHERWSSLRALFLVAPEYGTSEHCDVDLARNFAFRLVTLDLLVEERSLYRRELLLGELCNLDRRKLDRLLVGSSRRVVAGDGATLRGSRFDDGHDEGEYVVLVEIVVVGG